MSRIDNNNNNNKNSKEKSLLFAHEGEDGVQEYLKDQEYARIFKI